jgi:hypothetical protein
MPAIILTMDIELLHFCGILTALSLCLLYARPGGEASLTGMVVLKDILGA